MSPEEFRETLLREAKEAAHRDIEAVAPKIKRAIREGLKAAAKTQ